MCVKKCQNPFVIVALKWFETSCCAGW